MITLKTCNSSEGTMLFTEGTMLFSGRLVMECGTEQMMELSEQICQQFLVRMSIYLYIRK